MASQAEDGPDQPANPGSSTECNTLTAETVRIVAEANGVQVLPEEAARELAEQATHRIRCLLQDAQKYMMHAKRRKLTREDLDLALRTEGQEPLYGIAAAEHIPFRFASGGGRELHFTDDKELDLQELVSGSMPKIPLATSLRAHWLAIDGVQPSIPENPPAASKDQLLHESTNPLSKLNKKDAVDNKLGSLLQNQKHGAAARLKTTETVNVKQLAKHELSVEQQLYYKEITEACVGSDESRRAEALQSLAFDPGLHQMLPRLCTFIAEGVRVNVVQHNLAILIYLMRMVKSLLENQTLFLEKYLHELIPAVTTCIVARQLCARPDVDNHWALRDFASRLMANICKNFNTSTNNIQIRMTRMFGEALKTDKSPLVSYLPSYYGAIAGLQELGPEVIKVLIIPHIKPISVRLDQAAEGVNLTGPQNIDKITEKIRTLVVKGVTPVLKSVRSPPDNPEEYKNDFGSMGPYLYQSVVRSRGPGAISAAKAQQTGAQRPTIGAAAAQGAAQQRLYVVNNASGMQMVNQGAGQQRILMQQPSTPGISNMGNMFQADQQPPHQ